MSLGISVEERIVLCLNCVVPLIQPRQFTGNLPTVCDGCGKHLTAREQFQVVRLGDLPWVKSITKDMQSEDDTQRIGG
jgi:hypothetical protein